MAARTKTRITTIRLPANLYNEAKSVVRKAKGAEGSLSLNDLILTALRGYLRLYKRRQIDAAFAGMAEDTGYQREARLMSEDFAASDWEALRLKEGEMEGAEL
jgi:hypothetical protein